MTPATDGANAPPGNSRFEAIASSTLTGRFFGVPFFRPSVSPALLFNVWAYLLGPFAFFLFGLSLGFRSSLRVFVVRHRVCSDCANGRARYTGCNHAADIRTGFCRSGWLLYWSSLTGLLVRLSWSSLTAHAVAFAAACAFRFCSQRRNQ